MSLRPLKPCFCLRQLNKTLLIENTPKYLRESRELDFVGLHFEDVTEATERLGVLFDEGEVLRGELEGFWEVEVGWGKPEEVLVVGFLAGGVLVDDVEFVTVEADDEAAVELAEDVDFSEVVFEEVFWRFEIDLVEFF
jgi:hypothetical protein